MNYLALLTLIFSAIIIFVIAVPTLLLVLWLINRFLLGGRFKLVYRIVLAVVLPLLFLGGMIGYSYYEPYSTLIMNNRLGDIGMDLELPSYTITNHTSVFIGMDDRKDTYTIEFDDDVGNLIPLLDSLCTTSANWIKDVDSYTYRVEFFEGEEYETFTINPNCGTAEFVHYKR